MSEWKETTLGETCELQRGFDLPYDQRIPGNVPVVASTGITGWHSKAKVKGPGVVIGRSGSIGGGRYIEHDYWPLNTTLYVKDFKGNDSRFVYFLLKTIDFTVFNAGTGVPTLNRNHVASLKITLPPLATQRRIAAVLSTLDDKIELNNRINANLEAQAQALFRSWFVDFEPWGGAMPEGWRKTNLDEMTSKFGTGLNPRQNFKLGNGKNFYVTIKNMGNNRVYLDDRCDKVDDEALAKINKRSKLQKGDLLFSGIGTIGRVAMVVDEPTNWNTSESVFNMHPADGFSSEFLYVLLLSPDFQDYVRANSQGAVQQGIRMASLKAYTISLPPHHVLHQFDMTIQPLVEKIVAANKEIDTLAALRDTLLPKLMSGEIDVSRVEVPA